VTKIIITGDEASVRNTISQGIERLSINACGSAVIETSERMMKAALLQKEIHKKKTIYPPLRVSQVYSYEITSAFVFSERFVFSRSKKYICDCVQPVRKLCLLSFYSYYAEIGK